MRGRRNPDRPQASALLPPCRVCGEKGSGFHYGVTTCGACKGFFRRSLIRGEPYLCMKSHLCKVGPSTSRRQSCPKCRYDKCVSVGMSKDACKVGRYSLVKKSKDIAEMIAQQLYPSDEECSRTPDTTVHEGSTPPIKMSSHFSDDQSCTRVSSSSSSSSLDYSSVRSVHTSVVEARDYETKMEVVENSSSPFAEDGDHHVMSYCNVTQYGGDDKEIYSELESRDIDVTLCSSSLSVGHTFLGNSVCLNTTPSYPAIYEAKPPTPSSFLETNPGIMECGFSRDLETAAFSPVFKKNQEPSFAHLESTNDHSQYSSPLIPPLVHGQWCQSRATAATPPESRNFHSTQSPSMLSTQLVSAFEHPINVPSSHCAISQVTSPNPSYDFSMNSISVSNHHQSQSRCDQCQIQCHQFCQGQSHQCQSQSQSSCVAMEESHTSNNPNSLNHVSFPFNGCKVSSSQQFSRDEVAVLLSDEATIKTEVPSDNSCRYPTLTPAAAATRNYSIDELVAQSINTDTWSYPGFFESVADQQANPGQCTTLDPSPFDTSISSPSHGMKLMEAAKFKVVSSSSLQEIDVSQAVTPLMEITSFQKNPPFVCADSSQTSSEDEQEKCFRSESHSVDRQKLHDTSRLENVKCETSRLENVKCETSRLENVRHSQCLALVRSDSKTQLDKNEVVDDSLSLSPTSGTPSSFFLLFICPELAPYSLAMYEQFPFISYEQHCLRPFLNRCVDTEESFRPSFTPSTAPNCLQLVQDSDISQYLSGDIVSLGGAAGEVGAVAAVGADQKSPLGRLLDVESQLQISFSDVDLEVTLSSLMEAHQRAVGLETNSMTELEIKTALDVYKGMCKLRDRLHGPMQFIEKDTYNKILTTTGVDVDKRREYFGVYANVFNHNLPKAIRFFRSVPGFQAFSMEDRMNMAKASLYEYYIFSSYRGWDQHCELFINLECMIAVRFTVLEKLFPELTIIRQDARRVNLRLQGLNLTQEEIVLMKAISLTRPNRTLQLQDPMMAERLHQKFHRCLQMCLKKRSPDPDERYADLKSALKEVNFLGCLSRKVTKDNREDYLVLLDNMPVPLYTEAWFDLVMPPKGGSSGIHDKPKAVTT